ncbi:unnamed protein product [Echinostoma caproni]|uniref:BED-type domain-containing protein n=1 Tax=Echinostoma caproni TaxID=27848 RepID=A0A183A9J6_9TREM|nr:unnamed protein product [Echinostoma caproni]
MSTPSLTSSTGKNGKCAEKSTSKSSTMKLSPGMTRAGKSPGAMNGTKACAKKSFVWKYFRHPEMAGGLTDRSRTQCVLCDSQLAFNASGTTTTMLNHLKSRHGDVAEQEETARRHVRPCKSTSASTMDLLGSTDSSEAHGRGSFGRTLSGVTAGRLARSPLTIGQRGRPPGPNRRTKCSKMSDSTDYLQYSGMLQPGQIKPENTPLFPVSARSVLRA